jgi:predicted HNH restriction endonuclease
MKIYTVHDVAVILKKNSLLKYLKNYSIDLKIFPVDEDRNRIFYVFSPDNKWLSKFCFRLEPKTEKMVFMDYVETFDKLIKSKNAVYDINIKSAYIPEEVDNGFKYRSDS